MKVMHMDKKTIRRTVSIPENLDNHMRYQNEITGASFSAIIVMALKKYYERRIGREK